MIREQDVDPIRADGGLDATETNQRAASLARFVRRPGLIVLVACVLLFHLANAAMLPLVGSDVTARTGRWATVLVAACIIAPQIIVAAISPAVGQLAQTWGRRPVLLIGFATLPLRGGLLALTNDPYMVVAVQALDGISGAVMGVLVPLTLADIARGTGRFNLAQGIVGSATGIGATLSTIGAGYLADRFGVTSAFWGLAGMGVLALVLLIAMMPETRPSNGD
jgi:MFS family permease